MRPYETHPFSRPIDLIVINGPLLTNFSLLRTRFFGLHALYAPFFNFNFAQLCFARLLCFFNLLFSLSRSFFASKFFARGRTFNCLSNFFFYCFPCLFFSCNRLLQFFICHRTLSLTFYLFQRGCTFSCLNNFYRPKEQSLGHVLERLNCDSRQVVFY
jgi:hypothetical protein